MLKALQLFVQQGIEAKRASDKAEVLYTHKVRVSLHRGTKCRYINFLFL